MSTTIISKLGIALAALYLLLVFASIASLWYSLTYEPESSALSGVPLMVLTLPWSLLMAQTVGSNLPDSVLLSVVLLSFCGLINALIIVAAGFGLEGLANRIGSTDRDEQAAESPEEISGPS